MEGQKFVVNGINNDKIELVSNLDVRKLNRLIEATKAEWFNKGREREIIRCKDCIHLEQHHKFQIPACTPDYFDNWCVRMNRVVDDDWFCADGERKV